MSSDDGAGSAVWDRLVELIRGIATAQAARDTPALELLTNRVLSRVRPVRAVVEAGLGMAAGDASAHPAREGQAALLARDVYAAARETGVGLRSWLSVQRSARDAAATTTCAGVWWDTTLAVPSDVRAHWPTVLALGAGALSRRTGVAATGSGDLLFIGPAEGATDMVIATAWLLVLLEDGHLCAVSFTTEDVAWLTGLCDEMRGS